MKPNLKKMHMAVTATGKLILVLPTIDVWLPVTGFTYWPSALRPEQLQHIVPIGI
jgi:hypothetical protein